MTKLSAMWKPEERALHGKASKQSGMKDWVHYSHKTKGQGTGLQLEPQEIGGDTGKNTPGLIMV